jgi:hypothetical protein
MSKLRFRPALLVKIVVAASLICAVSYFYCGGVALVLISAANGLDVSYRSAESLSAHHISLNDFKALDRRTGLGISAKHLSIRPVRGIVGIVKADVLLDFRNGRFLKISGDREAAYGNLDALVNAPFNSRWTYDRIAGRIKKIPNGVEIYDLTANNADIKLSFTGTVHDDNTIRSDIKISFAGELAAKIPEELSRVVMDKEASGWKSLSVSVNGDFKSPSIQVASKLFRLNIKSVTG